MTGGLTEIQKTIELEATLEGAFRMWTEDLGRWWPLAEHSIGKADAIGCCIEPGIGGRLYETGRTGEQRLWGRVALWEPPRRLAYSWHPDGDLSERTMVLLMFTPLVPTRTRLTLTHSGWQAGQEKRRAGYNSGWDGVLEHGYVAYLASALAGG